MLGRRGGDQELCDEGKYTHSWRIGSHKRLDACERSASHIGLRCAASKTPCYRVTGEAICTIIVKRKTLWRRRRRRQMDRLSRSVSKQRVASSSFSPSGVLGAIGGGDKRAGVIHRTHSNENYRGKVSKREDIFAAEMCVQHRLCLAKTVLSWQKIMGVATG